MAEWRSAVSTDPDVSKLVTTYDVLFTQDSSFLKRFLYATYMRWRIDEPVRRAHTLILFAARNAFLTRIGADDVAMCVLVTSRSGNLVGRIVGGVSPQAMAELRRLVTVADPAR